LQRRERARTGIARESDERVVGSDRVKVVAVTTESDSARVVDGGDVVAGAATGVIGHAPGFGEGAVGAVARELGEDAKISSSVDAATVGADNCLVVGTKAGGDEGVTTEGVAGNAVVRSR
jgi:hypothetical protein